MNNFKELKNELLTINSLQNIIDKLEILEKDVEELKSKTNVINMNICRSTAVASV